MGPGSESLDWEGQVGRDGSGGTLVGRHRVGSVTDDRWLDTLSRKGWHLQIIGRIFRCPLYIVDIYKCGRLGSYVE